MYVSSYLTLDTALSGVEAAQEELDTTGENITNDSTTDYEEQQVNLTEADPLDLAIGAAGGSQLGTGVNVSGVTNVTDPYLDAAWRQQSSNSSGATTTQSYTEQIEDALNEPSTTGISSQLSQFWSDWQDLADHPTDTAAAQAVIDDGTTLSSSLNSLSAELTGSGSTSILSQAQSQYTNLMAGPSGAGETGGEVYNDAYSIASLNQQIVSAQASGQSANTLIDQRNEAIDDLSTMGNVTVDNNTDGSVTVYFGGVTSTALVSDPSSGPSGSSDPGNNFTTTWSTAFEAQFASANTAAATAAAATTPAGTPSAAALASTVGGTLGALIGVAGYSATGISSTTTPATTMGTAQQVQDELDGVAADLVNEVNNPTVVGSNPATTTSLTTDFFTSTGTTAATIAVNPTLTADAGALEINSSGNPGDNDIALDEANNSGGTADQAYDAFVQQVGDIAQAANDNDTTQSALSTQITNQRESVEGVDLSQEMSNLVQEQQSYQASARVMSAFSTVMDSLMSIVSD